MGGTEAIAKAFPNHCLQEETSHTFGPEIKNEFNSVHVEFNQFTNTYEINIFYRKSSLQYLMVNLTYFHCKLFENLLCVIKHFFDDLIKDNNETVRK